MSGSGKDEVGTHLEQRGYLHFSLSDCLRSEAAIQGLDTQRPTLRELGRKIRVSEGSGVLAMRGITHWQDLLSYHAWLSTVISGHFTLGEAEAIQDHGGSLWYVRASDELRFQRQRDRKRIDTTTIIEEMRANDQIELNGLTGLNTPNIGAVLQLPKITTIENNGTVEELHARVDDLIEGFSLLHEL